MSSMASQITSLTIAYFTVYSRRRSKKTSKLCVTGLCEGNSPVTGEFPAQRASNAENVSIWWRHHVYVLVSTVRSVSVPVRRALHVFRGGRCTEGIWSGTEFFPWIFCNENIWISIEISLTSVSKLQIKNIPGLVDMIALHRLGNTPLSEPMMTRLPTHICGLSELK